MKVLDRRILCALTITMMVACGEESSNSSTADTPENGPDTNQVTPADDATGATDTSTPNDTAKTEKDVSEPTDTAKPNPDSEAAADTVADTKKPPEDTKKPPKDTAVQPIVPLPNYTKRVLYARANFGKGPQDSFNLPNNHFFTNADIQLNNAGQVAFHLTQTPDSKHKLWFGSYSGNKAVGQIVYTAPDGAFMRQPSINNGGTVAFELSFAPTEGVYYFKGATKQTKLLTEEPMGAIGRTGLTLNDNDIVAFRAKLGNGKAYFSVNGEKVLNYAKETKMAKDSPYEFLFVPDFNNLGQIGGLVRMGQSADKPMHDQIRVWNEDGTSQLIAKDKDGDPESKYATFDSQHVSIDDYGRVAFQATLTNGNRGVFLSDGTITHTIAEAGKKGVADIGFFSPDVNDKGWVVFRAMDDKGRAIFVGNGQTVLRIIGEHDKVMTDAGPGQIDEKDDKAPVFGGSPSINDKGHVAFNASLTPEGEPGTEWGKGVFVARSVHK